MKYEFSMSDLGLLGYFLGNSVTGTPSYMLLLQKMYALEILERSDMESYKPAATHVDTNSKLRADSDPLVVDPTH